MIQCKLCNSEKNSIRSLSKHIRDIHVGIKSHKYYDQFLKKENEGKCKICGKNTHFINLGKGYQLTCSSKCGGIFNRRNLKLDSERHSNFAKKVSENQQNIWKERRKTGKDVEIRQKIGQTIKSNNSLLTQIELKNKYGWLNKLSKLDRQYWIDNVCTQTGAHKWWKTVDGKLRQKTIDFRNSQKLGISLSEYYNRYDNMPEIKLYYQKIWTLTETTYLTHKKQIDPDHKRGLLFHLDHKFSIIAGFNNQIPPEIISSVYNLQILSATENVRKSGKCSISLIKLEEMYHGKI